MRHPPTPKVERLCHQCGATFLIFACELRAGRLGRYCSQQCNGLSRRRGRRLETRWLKHGDAIPTTPPRREAHSEGYVVLVWIESPQRYLSAFEHRVVMGLPPDHLLVHHINENRSDNRPENLQLMTKAEHQSHHMGGFDVTEAAARYRAGWSCQQIAKVMGTWGGNVSRRLRTIGVVMRTNNAPRPRHPPPFPQ